jgi:two-component system response regulator AtoC
MTRMRKSQATVLVVDDDAAVRKILVSLLVQAGLEGLDASSGSEALRLLERRPVDVVITDLRMPAMDGLELLKEVGRTWPDVAVVMLTAHGTIALAVEAMKAGACDFLLKPFDRDEVLFTVNKAVMASSGHAMVPPVRPEQDRLLGDSRALSRVRELVSRAASGQANVLIRGETGTGKELVARAIHEQSPRCHGPLVKLNCAAFPDALLESELFGYERGAFTGAVSRKPGRLELGGGGTLFLDEIGDVPRSTQVKLLRVLQEREIERLGGTSTIKIDVRFVAATHRPLEAMVERGEFRQDLFYRLNVIPIDLPPLRERREDIELLARHFARTLAISNGRASADIEPAAIRLLAAQPWPGNIRQLENFVERLIVLSDGPPIREQDVVRELARESHRESESGRRAAASGTTRSLDDKVRQVERDALVEALARAGNNRSLAARLLGVSRRTLYNKLDELGLA